MRSVSRRFPWPRVWTRLVVLAALAVPARPGVAGDAAPAFDSAAALTDLRQSIAGHESDPAETVFKNVVVFKGMPAGRMLEIMEKGMNRALGVGCNHCHQPGKWDLDTDKKRLAREMAKMTAEVNVRLHLIDGVGDDAAINCTTCHRGETTPALELAGSH